ncbi:MAG: hypothetical protein IPP43_05750 [Chitinophagaceae bacterium]|nr:hypothetical protein [Chitinophagaceae bacterium]
MAVFAVGGTGPHNDSIEAIIVLRMLSDWIRKWLSGGLLLALSTGLVAAQSDSSRIQKITCLNDSARQYALYIPVDPLKEHKKALLIFFDPAGRGDFPVSLYQSIADEYGIILAGSYNSRNFDGNSSIESFVAVFNDIIRQHTIDPDRVWIAGFSGGARAAATIAMIYPEIKGVIACGAGFANDEEIKTENLRAYVALVGDRDMNYGELMDNQIYLDQKKVPNILLTFAGVHAWPSADQLGLGVEWLLRKEKNYPVLPSGRGPRFLASVSLKIDSGLLYAAWIDAHQLSKIPSYAALADSVIHEIESQKQFSADKERFRLAAIEEQNTMNDFSLAFSTMINQKEAVDKKNWISKVNKVMEMKQDAGRYRQLAGIRTFDHCTRSCMEYYFLFIRQADYKMALNIVTILSFYAPQDPESYYLQARASAGTGDKKNAEIQLREAVKKGLVNSNRVVQDVLLRTVFSAKEIRDLLEKSGR